jgi:hypothetical protein
MASRPPIADGDRGRAGLSSAEFDRALREATASLHGRGFRPSTARIPELRRALRDRATREEFEEGLRRLRDEGTVGLEPHAHPELLAAHEVQDALPEGRSILYVLRWLK